MALLRIERAITWIARALTANRDGNPVPAGFIDFILPNVDIFGSQRMEEVQIATVIGVAESIEESHSPVPEGRIRFYLSMSYTHDDPTDRALIPGRIIPTATGFPFAGFRDQMVVPTNRTFAVRGVTVGPGSRIAVRSNAMGVGTRMSLTVAWIEMPLGEYTRGIA